MEKAKRLFIAIELPNEVRAALASVSNYFQHPKLRWTPKQNLHVTTHFFGSVSAAELAEIEQLIAFIAKKAVPFVLTFVGLKTISKRRKPVMVWAAFEKSEAFESLALQLQENLPGDDKKAPVPHVTLARIKEGGLRTLPELPLVKQFSINVNRIELWESQLGSGQPVYQSLNKFELRNTADATG